jgi:hypothetical protein
MRANFWDPSDVPFFFDSTARSERHSLVPADYVNDDESGFQRIEAREIDTIGTWKAVPLRV